MGAKRRAFNTKSKAQKKSLVRQLFINSRYIKAGERISVLQLIMHV